MSWAKPVLRLTASAELLQLNHHSQQHSFRRNGGEDDLVLDDKFHGLVSARSLLANRVEVAGFILAVT